MLSPSCLQNHFSGLMGFVRTGRSRSDLHSLPTSSQLAFLMSQDSFLFPHHRLYRRLCLDSMAYGVPDPSLKFLPEPVDIRASSNGLLCCQGREGYKAYYICNPVTKQWKKLPKPDADHGRDPALVLIFEPSLLSFVAEYKLVCAFPSVDYDKGHEFEIYSSKEGTWRISGEILYGIGSVMPRTGVYANDIIYWHTSHHRLLSFDLKMERAQLVSYGSYDSVLGEMNGKLCSARPHGNGITISVLSNAYTNTMQMHSSVKAWSQKRSVNLNPAPVPSVPCGIRG